MYDPKNWYWFVGGDKTQAFSSASKGLVPVTDTTFSAWLVAGNTPTNIDTIASLQAVLATAGISPYAPVSLRQAHLAVIQVGLKTAVDNAIAADTTGALAAWWNYATIIERQHPMMLQVANTLSLDASHLDAMFTLASSL